MLQLSMPSVKRQFGNAGEDAAVKYLTNEGYTVLERNYQKTWAEIDIIAEKHGVLTFFEVKTRDRKYIGDYPAEYSINRKKMGKLQKLSEMYLAEKNCAQDQAWQIDVITITIDKEAKRARIKHIKNAVWEQRY